MTTNALKTNLFLLFPDSFPKTHMTTTHWSLHNINHDMHTGKPSPTPRLKKHR